MRTSLITRLSERLHLWARGRVVLALWGAFVGFMVGSLWLLSWCAPDLAGLASLDDPVWRGPDEIYAILSAWGATGRTQELWFHLTWDTVVPVMGFFCVALTLSWVLQRAVTPGSGLRRLNLLGLVTVFDLLENVFIEALILTHPARVPALAWLKTTFTALKYAGGAVLVVVLLGLVARAVRSR